MKKTLSFMSFITTGQVITGHKVVHTPAIPLLKLLSTYCVPGNVLSTGTIEMKEDSPL